MRLSIDCSAIPEAKLFRNSLGRGPADELMFDPFAISVSQILQFRLCRPGEMNLLASGFILMRVLYLPL